jgi:hypothetical protein
MDKKVRLTADQIVLLKDYIRSRGFWQPVEIQEILDHFACKVEELLSQDPSLPLQKALYQAHHSFGIKGFQPIVTELRKELTRKYKKIYRQAFKDRILSFQWLPLILLSGVVVFKFTEWTALSGLNKQWGVNVAGTIILLLYFIASLVVSFKINQFNRRNYFTQYCRYFHGEFLFIFYISVLRQPVEHQTVFSCIYGLVFVYLLLSLMASYKAIKAAIKDHNDFIEAEENCLAAVK